jgi:hypothetical protein
LVLQNISKTAATKSALTFFSGCAGVFESNPKVAVELELTKVPSELPKALPQGSL